LLARDAEARELVPLLALVDALLRAERLHLGLVHQPGVVVFVTGEGQAEALDRVADEADRLIVWSRCKCLEEGPHAMTTEIGHEARKLVVVAPGDKGQDFRIAGEIRLELPAPSLGAFEDERGVELVRAVGDPGAQALAARLSKGGLLQLAVLDENDLPAEIL